MGMFDSFSSAGRQSAAQVTQRTGLIRRQKNDLAKAEADLAKYRARIRKSSDPAADREFIRRAEVAASTARRNLRGLSR